MQQESILIVDDEPLNLEVLSQLLTPQYKIKFANPPKTSFDIYRMHLCQD